MRALATVPSTDEGFYAIWVEDVGACLQSAGRENNIVEVNITKNAEKSLAKCGIFQITFWFSTCKTDTIALQ